MQPEPQPEPDPEKTRSLGQVAGQAEQDLPAVQWPPEWRLKQGADPNDPAAPECEGGRL